MNANQLPPNNSQQENPWWKLHFRSLAVGVLVAGIVASGSVYLSVSRTSSSSHRVATTTSPAAARNVRTTSSRPPVGTGYLAKGASFVDFIQWNDSGGSLNGSEQTVDSKGQVPNLSTLSSTLQITGTIQGRTISLSFDGFNGGAPVFGTVAEGSVVLNFPQANGTLVPIVFRQADAAAFNNAVAQLQNTISAANRVAIQSAQALQAQKLHSFLATAVVLGTIQGHHSTLATTLQGNQSVSGGVDEKQFTFGRLPLVICYRVPSPSVSTLSYEIGSGGYHLIYDSSGGLASSSTTGCVWDPGNDLGPETFKVFTTGHTQYSVTVYQQGGSSPQG